MNTEHYNVLPPLLFIGRLTFFASSLTTRLIQKFMQNITSFIMACFINKVLQNNLNLAMFVQIFLNKTSGQTWIQKSQTSYKKEWRE